MRFDDIQRIDFELLYNFHYGSLHNHLQFLNVFQVIDKPDRAEEKALAANLQLGYGMFRNQSIYLKSDGLDLQLHYILKDGSLHKLMKSLNIHSDDNLHNLLKDVNLLKENLMLRD